MCDKTYVASYKAHFPEHVASYKAHFPEQSGYQAGFLRLSGLLSMFSWQFSYDVRRLPNNEYFFQLI